MAEYQEKPKSGISELEKIFEEYKEKLRGAEAEAEQILNGAWGKAEQIIAEGQEKNRRNADIIKQQTQTEADTILREARSEAERILKEASEDSRKKAKERTKAETEKILRDTRGVAEKTAEDILVKAKNQAERILEDSKKRIEAEAAERATAIITDARKVAAKVDDEVMMHIVETSKALGDGVQRFEGLVSDLTTQLHEEVDKILKDIAVMKASARNWEALKDADQEMLAPDAQPEEYPKIQGWLKLSILPPCDAAQVKELTKIIKKIPHVKLAGNVPDGENVFLYLDVQKPVPLQKYLQEASIISSVSSQKDSMTLKLKDNVSLAN